MLLTLLFVVLMLQDEFSSLVQQWNEQRSLVLKQSFAEMLYPLIVREMKAKLLDEAKQSVIQVLTLCFGDSTNKFKAVTCQCLIVSEWLCMVVA